MLLVIDHKNTYVHCESTTLFVKRDNKKPQRIPIKLLEQMIIYGSPHIDLSVWWALAEQGIPAILLPNRSSKPAAILANGLATRLPLRRLQYRCAEHSVLSFLMARWIVASKIESYQLPLSLIEKEHQGLCGGFIERCNMAHESLETADHFNSLMGIEGQLASQWFQLLRKLVDKKWQFTGRNRRPPRDPLNSLLSLGYTLLGGDVRQALVSEGLDPALGFLHQPRSGRDSLMLDLLEPFRSGVDLFSLQLLQQLEPSDFSYHEKQGCRLNKKKRGLFFALWSQYRQKWPRLLVNIEENSSEKYRYSPVQEQLRGEIAQFRKIMAFHYEKITT
jgi:CRISPR-associated protein Cas1